MNNKISRRFQKVESLSSEQIKIMFDLFQAYYDHVSFERFVQDLKEKTHVFMFYEKGSQRLVGFSTIFRKSLPKICRGSFLFSGDTVIHHDFWGSKALQKSFFFFILNSKLRSPFSPVYWMLMSKGVKTYLMMRKNFQESYPNYLRSIPNNVRHARDEFYKLKFDECYRPERGLILFPEKIGSVKNDIQNAPEGAKNDPDSLFFFKTNPGFGNGDELACICEIRFRDFLLHFFKYFIPVKKRIK